MNWKGQAVELSVHWLFPVLTTAAILLLLRRDAPPGLRRLDRRWIAAAVFLLSRLAYPAFLQFVLGRTYGYDSMSFHLWGNRILAGEIPGREHAYHLSPLLPYLHAGALALLPRVPDLAVLLPFMLAEAVAVFLGAGLAGSLLGPGRRTRVLWWLLLTPLLWHNLAVFAADESLFLGALTAAVWLLHRERANLAAAALAAGLLATKALFAPYAFAVLAVAWNRTPRRWAPPAVFGGICAAAYGGFALLGYDPLAPAGFTAPVWWFSLARAPFWIAPGVAQPAALALWGGSCLAAAVWAARRGGAGSVAWRTVVAVSAVHAASMLTQPHLVVNYLAHAVTFVLILLAGRPRDPLARGLLLLLPALALLVSVTHEPWTRLYRYAATPCSLAFHALLLVLVLRTGRRGPAPPRNDRGGGVSGNPGPLRGAPGA